MIVTIDLVTGEVTSDAVRTVRSELSRNRMDRSAIPMPDVALNIRQPEPARPAFPEGLAYRDVDSFLDEMRQ